jgi:2-(3-amino-3-carboxypropyl)histidine synthase
LYDFELEHVIAEIKTRKAKKVLLQLPDGMRPFAFQIVNSLEQTTDSKIILSGDSCYGACDIALSQAQQLSVDLIVHYGHSPMIDCTKTPVVYVHANIDIDIDKLLDAVHPKLKKYNSIGLATTVQHAHQVKQIKKKLEERGIKIFVGSGSGKTPLDAQILGCTYQTVINIMKEVDAYLYVGGGQFHPMGIIMSTSKPVIVANPYSGCITKITEDDLMNLAKRRMAAITKARNSTRFAILVSSKPGQNNIEKAIMLQEELKEQGKHVIIIYLDEVKSEHINNFSEPEILINTACPRIAIDGIKGINKPMLTINEVEVVLRKRKWENLWGDSYLE